MTTGSRGLPIKDANSYETRVWNGGDGKYEVVNGKKRIKFNPYTLTATSHQSSPAYWSYKTTPPVWKINLWPNVQDPGVLWSLNDTVKLQAKLASKLKTTTLHLGKNVAEGKQFVGMVSKTLFTVAKVIKSLKKGDAQHSISVLIDAHRAKGGRFNYEIVELLKRHRIKATDVAGMWLELQYGWLPLLSDVKAASELFESQMESERIITVSTGTSRTLKKEVSVSPTVYSIDALIVLNQRIKYEYAENEVISLQRKLGLEDPAGIIWEVIPYSFVIDWFMPIGSYLESLNILPDLKGRWISTKTVMWSTRKVKQVLYSRDYLENWATCSCAHTSVSVTRTVGSGFSFGTIAPPDLKPMSEVFSPSHIYNAVALATQMISGGGTSRR